MSNREIKFRGYRVNNGEWAYGDYMQFPEESGDYNNPPSSEMITYIADTNALGRPCVIVDPETIGQYTGLKDKNGVEIYEGDICRILYTDWPSKTDDNITLVEYKKSISSIGKVDYDAPLYVLNIWSQKFGEFISNSIEYGQHGEIEVIGNIHQHPHLLNQ